MIFAKNMMMLHVDRIYKRWSESVMVQKYVHNSVRSSYHNTLDTKENLLGK